MAINIVWLKRDLRIQDHAPLKAAIDNYINNKEKFAVVYIFEPEAENHYDFDLRHWQFIYGSLLELRKSIPVSIAYGSAEEVFSTISELHKITNIFSHEETGVMWTYERDIALKQFCKKRDICWHEYQTNGVVRGLKNRNGWDAAWIKHMSQKPIRVDLENVEVTELELASLTPYLLEQLKSCDYLTPGPKAAKQLLDEFVNQKVEDYFKNISMPEKSRYHCSWLSTYLSWGNLSVRQVYQYCRAHRDKVKNKMSMDQFMARLKWRCHFVQKLEMQTDLEFDNLNPAFDHIRKKKNKKYFKAWRDGKTGFPLIDAAMRCVQATGYLNFRLRATLVSFLTHHLFQPWQPGARHLARLFIDYEPGIHFSQFQMQAGTTGINTIRIYNPVKQSLEKDKEAVFLKKWLPELAQLPTAFIHEPWKMSEMEQMMYGVKLGRDYPKRIVDHEEAARYARDQLWKIKKDDKHKCYAQEILAKHTRRSPRNESNWKR